MTCDGAAAGLRSSCNTTVAIEPRPAVGVTLHRLAAQLVSKSHLTAQCNGTRRQQETGLAGRWARAANEVRDGLGLVRSLRTRAQATAARCSGSGTFETLRGGSNRGGRPLMGPEWESWVGGTTFLCGRQA